AVRGVEHVVRGLRRPQRAEPDGAVRQLRPGGRRRPGVRGPQLVRRAGRVRGRAGRVHRAGPQLDRGGDQHRRHQRGRAVLGRRPGTYTVKLATLPPGFALSGAKATGQYTAAVDTGSSSPNNNLTGLDFGMIGRKRYALGADGGGGPRVQVYDAVNGDLLSD